MAHSHSHDDQTNFYVEQIFTIAVCGAIGGVMVILYTRPILTAMLSADQHPRVLFGGIGLILLVLIRAAYVWIAAGQTAAKKANGSHDHGHAHNHNHDHDHAHCDHDHNHEHGHADHDHADCDHDHHHESVTAAGHHDHFHDNHGHVHEHGWAPWRYALLILPVVLFLIGLPNSSMSAFGESGIDADLSGLSNTAAKETKFTIGFNQLERAALNQSSRTNMAGTVVSLTGQYRGDRPDRFTLVRFKRTCCAADAIPLKAVIMIDPEKAKKFSINPNTYRNQWVRVTGRVEFSQVGNSNEYVPVIILEPESQEYLTSKNVKLVDPDPNPYAND
jgi:hypothetical protein